MGRHTVLPLQCGGEYVPIFSHDFCKVKLVPRAHVVHLPPSQKNINRWAECKDFNDNPTGCNHNDHCNFVHVFRPASEADASCTSYPVHVNFQYRTLEGCELYARHRGEGSIQLASGEKVLKEHCLVTAARVDGPGGVLRRCHNFDALSYCGRASCCTDLHCIDINPNLEKERSIKKMQKGASDVPCSPSRVYEAPHMYRYYPYHKVLS